ncbi:MAG: hypothetical protein HYX55_03340 [Chloroflexi bacterium]|nr:hypothetical protein [Chloroflexota bacterium]
MSSRTEIERALDGFFAEGPESVADQAVMRTLDAIDRTPQRRDLFAPWRFPLMITLPRLAAAALVAVIAVGGAAYLLGAHSSVGVPVASPTPLAPSPTTGAVIPTTDTGMGLDTTKWTQFSSPRYGFTVAWPNTGVWINAPATEDWSGQTSYDMWASSADAPWVDKFYDSATQLTMTAVATTIPVGTTEEAFIDAYLKPGESAPATCPEPAKAMRATLIDGHPARETTRCGDQAAFVAFGQRMYVFSISNQNEVPFLDAYLSTVRLPTLDTSSWVPFTSANYGFTIAHPRTWTEVPATSLFSYSTIQPDSAADVLSSTAFDLTNYAAVPPGVRPVLLASEAKIPAGMTADALLQQFAIDAYGSACYPGANLLQKITVDGRAATLAYGGCTTQYYFAEASVVIGNRVWIFELRGPDRPLIVPFLSTLKLDPMKVVN